MTATDLLCDSAEVKQLISAVRDQQPVQGLTHSYYRYPARFSPNFAERVIELLTDEGDLVLDPFVGGGTTLVEAVALGRRAAGADISPLAQFVSQVKTTWMTDEDLDAAIYWAEAVVPTLKINREINRPTTWIDQGYQRNLNTPETWRLRKAMELAIAELPDDGTTDLNRFLRCAILSTGQWGLDCRYKIPPVGDFRDQLRETIYDMVIGMHELIAVVEKSEERNHVIPVVVNAPAADLPSVEELTAIGTPHLVLTSPPYPGVHVVYHRWQIRGRRETPAPFWVANRRDGNGASYYLLGDRRQEELRDYFANLETSFHGIRKVCGDDTILVQLVAFSDTQKQLPRYLETMAQCRFEERFLEGADGPQGRIWREVPNRRWYAENQEGLSSKNEVLLIHRPI